MKHTEGMRFKIREAVFDLMIECGCCGFYHPQDWEGDCRNDEYRYHPDDFTDLLLSAPDLLEACEACLQWIKGGPMNQDNPYKEGGCVEKTLKAISKAKGSQ